MARNPDGERTSLFACVCRTFLDLAAEALVIFFATFFAAKDLALAAFEALVGAAAVKVEVQKNFMPKPFACLEGLNFSKNMAWLMMLMDVLTR